MTEKRGRNAESASEARGDVACISADIGHTGIFQLEGDDGCVKLIHSALDQHT